jgi:hypothetical protein
VPNTLDGTLFAQTKDHAPYQNAVHGNGDGSLRHFKFKTRLHGYTVTLFRRRFYWGYLRGLAGAR